MMTKTEKKYNDLDDLNKKSAETILSQIFKKENEPLTKINAAEILVEWNPTIILENNVMTSFSEEDRNTIDNMIIERRLFKRNSN